MQQLDRTPYIEKVKAIIDEKRLTELSPHEQLSLEERKKTLKLKERYANGFIWILLGHFK